jgi:hypothetical protein
MVPTIEKGALVSVGQAGLSPVGDQARFFEFSKNASSYRGGLLGLVAIHTLFLHACWFYQPPTATGKIICDSKLALYKSREGRKVTEGSALG